MRPSPLTRLTAVVCLAGVAVAHLIGLPDKLEEARYMAVLFCGLIAASLVLAAALAAGRHVERALRAAGLLSALTIIGYVLSRTVGLPQLEDDVGAWMDPAGIVSLLVEVTLVGLAVPALPLPELEVRREPHAR
jgi:MFS family permease